MNEGGCAYAVCHCRFSRSKEVGPLLRRKERGHRVVAIALRAGPREGPSEGEGRGHADE